MTPRADNRKDRANGVTLASIIAEVEWRVALASTVAEVEKQLEWRGPSGRSQDYVMLDRPQAELLLQMAYEMMKKPMVPGV